MIHGVVGTGLDYTKLSFDNYHGYLVYNNRKCYRDVFIL
jgi:hypothetical protein